MLAFFQQNQFVVGALTGGLAAYLLSLIVSYLTREKKQIKYSISSRLIVEKGHKDLAIHYRGQEIERLQSHHVVIRNSGNRALKEIPIRISIGDGKIVDFGVEYPEGANVVFLPESENQVLKIICDLLNRGEAIQVGITSIDTKSSKIRVSARQENLSCEQEDVPFLSTYSFSDILGIFLDVIANSFISIGFGRRK